MAKEASRKRLTDGLNAMADRSMQQRSDLLGNQLLHTQFITMNWVFAGGRPITEAEQPHGAAAAQLKHPHVSDMHWSLTSTWQMADWVDQ